MSIEIQHLSKLYGKQKAVDDISFKVDDKEIVAFLGPNGAGKSTTMKIATCYIPPSDGTVLINGMDVQSQPLKIKQTIGYLPEHNPLYLDMYVHEYLRFSGRFYGLKGSKLKSRISKVVDMCQLSLEQNKLIGQLSKGYRQRVGLAQALLHDPSVLILDEPTSGLDPNQIIEVRNLIKEISLEKTVLFSTHIMQEVQAICDRVVVINHGSIVADDNVANLALNEQSSILEIEFSAPIDHILFAPLVGLGNIHTSDGSKIQISMNSDVDLRPQIMEVITNNSLPMIGMSVKTKSLEEIFSSLTHGTDV